MTNTLEKEPVAGFVSDRPSANQKRIERDEAELAELEELARNGAPQGTEEEDPEEEAVTPKPKEEDEGNWKKRYSDLRSHSAKKEKEKDDRIKALEDQLNASNDNSEIPSDEAELNAWMEKNPDAGRIISKIADRKAQEKFDKMGLEIEEIKLDREEANRAKSEAALRTAHPDWDELKEADEFHDWIEAQPQAIQDSLYKDTNAESAIRVISIYKLENKKEDDTKPKKDTSAAKSVNTKSKPAVDTESVKGSIRESDVAKMSDKEYAEREAEIDKAQSEGKFIYDMSGGAR